MTNETIIIQTWDELRETFHRLNPIDAAVIDELPNVHKFKLATVRYEFGMDVIKNGEFYVNSGGENVPFDKANIPASVRQLFDYPWQTSPFGMVTQHSIESYIDHTSHRIPFRLLHPGKTFSLLTIFEGRDSHLLSNLYSTSSGAKSLFSLAPLRDMASIRSVNKKYHIRPSYGKDDDDQTILAPKRFMDHWKFFHEIYQSKQFSTPWYSDVVYFSKDFLNDKNQELILHLMKKIWKTTSFPRNKEMYDFIWSQFLKHCGTKIRHDFMIIATVQYLIRIAMGLSPGYVPAVDNYAGPIQEFIDVVLNDYKIRYHLPIMMHLKHFDDPTPVYYSLQHPCFLYDIPRPDSKRQSINDIITVEKVLRDYVDFVMNDRADQSLKDTVLYKILSQTEFDFFHTIDDARLKNHISTETIVEEDPRFMKLIAKAKAPESLGFPYSSLFFNGCVRIRQKKK